MSEAMSEATSPNPMTARPEIRLSDADIEHIFTYHTPRPDQTPRFENLNAATKDFARAIRDNVRAGPDRTIAIRSLQRLRMDCNLAIALEPAPSESDPWEARAPG